MDKEEISQKCDRIFVEKAAIINSMLVQQIHAVYDKHAEQLGSQIDYPLLTAFTDDLIRAYTKVIKHVIVEAIHEALSDDFEDS